ncbi:MAG: NAD(P)-binding domain-containing protein [Alphaproteobacteria bacterium]|nr:NAD(P)-binding domain-containing protein [Alphaproteobacteria bacterium]
MGEMVALIGVGKMGRALLHRLKLQGHDVAAFDIASEPMETARALGAETAASSAEAAQAAAIVHVFVHNDQEVFDATLGPAGVLEGAKPGTLVLLHSTILPATTFRVAEAAGTRGIDVLDAAVTSVPRRLQAGEGNFLVGGREELVTRARAHLLPLGKSVHHFGPLGAGNTAKIAKNLTNAVERVMLAECVRIVETAGLDVSQFLNMARDASSGAMVQTWERFIRFDDAGHAGPARARGLLSKDVQHAARVAGELGLDLPVTRATAETALKWLAAWAEEPASGPAKDAG